MTDEGPILVIAGNYSQFVFWCREHEINPRDTHKARYVRDWNDLRGRRGCRYVFYGTTYERRDIPEIYNTLRVIEAIPLEDT